MPKELDRFNSTSENRPNLSILTPISKTTNISALYKHTQKRTYLDNTKLFIKLNYQILSLVMASSKLSSFAKVLVGFLCDKHLNDYFAFICSYKGLENQYSCKKAWVSKTIKSLEESSFIKRSYLHVKNEDDDDNLRDKSLWNMTVTIPKEYLKLEKQIEVAEEGRKEIIGEENSDTNNAENSDISYFPPYVSDNNQLLNKDPLINNLNIKNTDNVDVVDKNLNLPTSGKSLSNLSVFLNNTKIIKDSKNNPLHSGSIVSDTKPSKSLTSSTLFKAEKSLKDFYPLTKAQVDKLNSLSGVESLVLTLLINYYLNFILVILTKSS
ncbi:MAG: hypothetical protein RCG15_06455 [Candidatus Rickettsia vulgarisii]